MMDEEYPVDGLLPKRSTEASAFLEQYPKYDGRGVLVAILDTGVDPGAAGLQYTSDGKKKMVGLLDTSGGGDVAMTKVVKGKAIKEEEDCWVFDGLSGRTLCVDKSLDNPSGEWRLGLKSSFELFPSGLTSRNKRETTQQWERSQAKALRQAREELIAFDAKHKVDPTAKKSTLGRNDLIERNELKARVDLLEGFEKDREDLGEWCDCVVFRGGDGVLRALVDRSGSGDLRGVRALRPFAVYDDAEGDDFEFDKWDESSQLNFGVNIYEEGAVLSIVVDSGAHGTHVASITAGFHEAQPELNGVAPGAQIVSMKIGDGRIDGMETSAAIIRAFNACVELGVDVINMSFGEPTSAPDQGRTAELARDLVEKHGVIFVSSAGNAGPALSTVGAPGATSDALIGVGACVERAMMLADYSMKPGEGPPPKSYTWSSRGPRYDGGMGVTITAPGAAIAAVPEWTLRQKRLMNGTSMASPNAAGGIALVVSGLRALGVKYAPCMVKRALEATAVPVPGTETHAQGSGLIQVAKTFELLRTGSGGIHFETPYRIRVAGNEARTNAGLATGIYLREPWESQEKRDFVVYADPVFSTEVSEDAPRPEADMTPQRRAHLESLIMHEQKDRNKLEARLHIRCTEPWVQATPFVMLNAGTVSVKVSVDAPALPDSSDGRNQVHFAQIQAFDPARGDLPVFSVPVTVIRPEACALAPGNGPVAPAVSVARMRFEPVKRYSKVAFGPGDIVRHFVAVPEGASWMDISLRPSPGEPSSVTEGASRTFYVHCLQMRQQGNYRDDELSTAIALRQEPTAAGSRAMAVQGGGTVEICVAQYWSSLGSGPIDIEVRFAGVTPMPSKLSIGAQSAGVARVDVRAELGSVRVSPSAKLKSWSHAVRPVTARTKLELMPAGPRDSLLANPTRPSYGLMLEYTFKQAEKGKLTVRAPQLDQLLYESPYDSQMCMLFDANKRLLNYQDAWPKAVEVPKGSVTARILVRHEKVSLLERLREMPLVIERQLSSDISLGTYKTRAGATTGTQTFSPQVLSQGERCAVFFALPLYKDMAKSLPKGVAPGDVLTGLVTYGRRNGRNTAIIGTDRHPDGFPVEVAVIAAPGSGPDGPGLADDDDNESTDEPLDNATSTSSSGGDDDEDENGAAQETAADSKGEEEARGEEDEDEDEGESEAAVKRAFFAHALLPILKTRVKSLDELRKKPAKAMDGLFAEIVKEAHEVLKLAKEKYGADPADSAELAALELQIAKNEMLRAVAKHKKLLLQNDAADGDSSGRQEVTEACDRVIALVDTESLLAALPKFRAAGDLDDVGQTEKQKEANKKVQDRRSILVEALVLKTYAGNFEGIEELQEVLTRVAETKDLGLQQLRMSRFRANGRPGLALQVLEKKLAEPGAALDSLPLPLSVKELEKTKLELLKELGWPHLAKEQAVTTLHKFPPAYPPF
ncbi:Tripeptidyl-peptidase 2 [Hondaea fermentalgiana]|uniref:Tripeptidyl-peptidase 2 n=1 Tax=Hondaea fermentalgiana TaxID=2315210 RepID=A0A2R5G2M8_9STRA|nr:Tripeptidyl-peptidase 2 [Hondaea fermentalgiana]|eukprot:GBG25276.1 Tripeptidyl-peptidase 2 [Hondaea fermentalgiana]